MNPRFKSEQSDKKLRGAYYTPLKYAEYITKWVLSNNPKSILEPSCGDGVFVEAVAKQLIDKNVLFECYELVADEAYKAKLVGEQYNLKNHNVICGDFLESANIAIQNKTKCFDAIVGNPPYIRYQFIDNEFQLNAKKCAQLMGCKFTRLTNSWVVFILASLALLNDGGRLGMVIPSELLHVLYANELRNLIQKHASKIMIVNPKEIWFKDTTQGTLMLLVEKKKKINESSSGLALINVKNDDFLNSSIEELFSGVDFIELSNKWTETMLKADEREIYLKLKSNPNIRKFSSLAKASVAITSGANEFFIVDNECVSEFGLENVVHPIFSKSHQCRGVVYDIEQHQKNLELNECVNYIMFKELSFKHLQYIAIGESKKFNERYKCRVRPLWYVGPNVPPQDGCINKFSHENPKVVVNKANAYTTDGFYRIKMHDGFNIEELASAFLNPLTMLSAELEGRYYGGGVLELTPSEIQELLVPTSELRLTGIEVLNAKLVSGVSYENLIYENGWDVLSQLGLTKFEYEIIYQGWLRFKKIRQRN